MGAARLRDGQKLGVHQTLDARAASASAPAGRAAHTRAHTHTQIRALSHTHTLIPVHCTHSCNQHTHCTHKSQRTLACIAHSHTHALLHTHTHMHTHLHTMLKHTPICIQLIHTFGTLDTHISTLTCTLTHTPIHTPIIHMHARILTLRHAARFNIHAFHTLIKLHSHSHTLSRAHATCPCSPGPLGGVGAPRLVLLGTTRPSPPSLPRRDPSAAGLCRWPFTGLIRSVSKTLNEFGWSRSGDCAPVCTMPVGRPGATRRSVATRGRAMSFPEHLLESGCQPRP